MRIYESIPEFGQLVEYITQAKPVQQGKDIYYGLEFHHIPITKHEIEKSLVLHAILEDYVHVFKIKARELDLELSELNAVIPEAIRKQVNSWMTKQSWSAAQVGVTYKQLLIAIRDKASIKEVKSPS